MSSEGRVQLLQKASDKLRPLIGSGDDLLQNSVQA
jgi:hypothetical protein